MLNNEIIKDFGEAFTSLILFNMGFKVDIINDEGIDIACYKGEQRYGISVKCRNLIRRNDAINLNYNDIVYTYDNSLLRKLTPAYAFVTSTLERIDVLIVTQKYVLENYVNVESIEKYKFDFKSKNDSGSVKSVNISKKKRENWRYLKGDGVIYADSYLGYSESNVS